MAEVLTVNGKEYSMIKLLGKGKGGYSYLAEAGGQQYVLKQIHHEPCDYYQFGDKLAAERGDYERLRRAGVRVPEMLDVDVENERILKEYIDGETILDLVQTDGVKEEYIAQVREMSDRLRAAGLNIDWFPTNFIPQNGLLYYVDYECNSYMDEWSFESWGVRYWSKTPELARYLEEKEQNERR